jgi:exodeoxyribonuclease-5
MTMGGFAGTGKTHTIAHVVRSIDPEKRPRIAFCAFTGKAASILRSKLEAVEAMESDDFCGTIHSLIYNPIFNAQKQVIGYTKKEPVDVDYKLIICDEASMIDEQIFTDLMSYSIPILAVGDHGQLPPVMGRFNLMEQPDIRLEKIHRQAKDNPIIRLSMMAREDGRIPVGEYGPGVRKVEGREELHAVDLAEKPLFLCGKNETRVRLNGFVRAKLGIKSAAPVAGDVVICLKNNRFRNLFNGLTGRIVDIESMQEHWYYASILIDGQPFPFSGKISRHQFNQRYPLREVPGLDADEIGNLFDFGYCLTVHKAQGSESKNVVVIEERMSAQTDDTWRRWLYTAITRAKERLLIVS